MPSKTNEVYTLKLGQIIKNAPLALGMSSKCVNKYKKIVGEYGNVVPVIVGAPQNGGYPILTGSAQLEACVQAGIREIPVVMSGAQDEIGQLKLSLMLIALQDESSAISEGELINRLVNGCSVAPRELVKLLGKSKAWVSKRLSLANNLSGEVKKMVIDGTLCPRSAEEVAKLEQECQAEFAVNAVNAGLNKNEISLLAQLYKKAHTENLKREIVKSPLEALSKATVIQRNKLNPDAGLNSPGKKLQSSANYAAQMLLKTANMAENASEAALCAAAAQLVRLNSIMEETAMLLKRALSDVSPGEHQGAGRANALPAHATGGDNKPWQ
jgi:ParB-like chromosome segregation protein Spo0J